MLGKAAELDEKPLLLAQEDDAARPGSTLGRLALDLMYVQPSTDVKSQCVQELVSFLAAFIV